MQDSKFSPKKFLKSRHPKKYSDSINIEKTILDRSVLEHHLATLNKRSQELAFEDYAKGICEKVICPNLLAQTGPVAGGDGKVDSQTFPVSEQNQLMWYEGINDTSHKERWAFAVSTRVDWKVKCRDDVLKIKKTDRGYVKAFFVTNQYAKSDQRSYVEDKLEKETGIDVRILDISWLLDQTFKYGLEAIAIEKLSLTTARSTIVKQGPNDYRKESELATMLDKIHTEVNPQEIPTHQVDMFLEVALLSKEIEKSVLETQGLFDRAVKVASKFGTNQQQFDTHYEYAWAAHWWFEDFGLFESNFEQAFNCIINSTNASKWENIVTLISVHTGHVRLFSIEPSIDITSIKSKTRLQLTEISADDARPSNSLQARTSLALLDLLENQNLSNAKSVLKELLSIAKESERLVGYPFESLLNLVSEMDQIYGDITEYETLLDYLTEQSANRYGDVQISLNLLKRGAKRLDSGKPYQAIKLVGKSLLGLYKHESRKDIVIALNIISQAYVQVGLLWAARGTLLLAASLVTDTFWRSDEITPAQMKAYLRLTWVEMQLGRICHALTWLRLALLINSNLEESIIKEAEILNFDGYLGHCLLRADLSIIKTLERLPDILDELGIFNARAMLLYCLGHEDKMVEEFEIEVDEEFLDYLRLVRGYDFGVRTPRIDTFTGRWSEITSSVLGCQITLSFPLKSPFVELAESILSVIEGFCATGIVDNVTAIESRLKIDISADDDEDLAVFHEIDDSSSEIVINVTCSSFTPDMLNVSGQKVIQDWLQTLIFDVYGKIMVPKRAEENIRSLLVDDKALERSISFGACFTTQNNVLGNNAIKDISSLLEGNECKIYKAIRNKNWDIDFPTKQAVKPHVDDYKPSHGVPPEDIADHERLSHTEIRTHGLIKKRLWDKAKWNGTGYLYYPDGLPVLSLLFENEQAANVIFADLLAELGSNDPSNRLRVSIIRKVCAKEPFSYRICIMENPSFGESKVFTTISRSNTMTPTTNALLNNFLEDYSKVGRFGLTFGVLKQGNQEIPLDYLKMTIIKSGLIVKDAWEIGPNELEVMAIRSDDTPIIPENIENPPIIETMRRLQGSSAPPSE